MAGDWIKWEKGLANKPEVSQIAWALKVSRLEAAARLMMAWEWADGMTQDGLVEGMRGEDLDAIAGSPGLAAAMQATLPTPWLIVDSTGLIFPKYQRHNGDSAKRRLMAAERKRLSRARHAEVTHGV